MHEILEQFGRAVELTGNLERDVPRLLIHYGCSGTASHSLRVASFARRIATLTGADPSLAIVAGLLHDVSAVIPSADTLDVAKQLGLEVLPEEETFPGILHQKLSAVLAQEVFMVSDSSVLSAIGCHTTLRAGATVMDKVLFVADKIEWDQADAAPYLEEMVNALDRSLDEAALGYLHWMWTQQRSLRVIHPWLKEAYEELSGAPWKDLPQRATY